MTSFPPDTTSDAARILESITDASFALDAQWRFTYINSQAEKLLSSPRAELLGKNVWEEFPAAVGTAFDRQYHRAASEGNTVTFEEYYPPPLDTWFEVRAYPSADGLSVYFHDITERVRRLKREQFLADLAERARLLADPDEVIADALRSIGEFLGASRAVFVDIEADGGTDGRGTITIHPDYRADDSVVSMAGQYPISAFGQFVIDAYAQGKAVAVDDVRSDPVRVPEHSRASYEGVGILAHIGAPVVHSARLVSCIGVHSPIPRHWTPEEVDLVQSVVERTWLTVEVLRQHRALAREAETSERILESITDAFFTLDGEYRFAHVNRETERVLFKSREELLGRYIWEVFPEGEGSKFDLQYRHAVAEGVAVTFEEFYPPLDTWFDVRAYPSEGGLSVFYQDVTVRRRAQEALRRSQEDLQLAIDAARLGTFYCDWPLDKIVWNQTCKEHFFLPPDAEVDFALFYSLIHPDDREPTRQAIERAMAERAEYDVEYRTLAPDGRSRWVNAVGRFYYRDNGTPVRFDGITIDISARKAAEEESRRRAEREALLSRVGQALRASSDPEQVLETAVRELGLALGANRCYYASYNQDADTAIVGPDWHCDGLPSIAGQHRMSAFAVNRDPVYQAGRTQVLADTGGDTAAQELGLRALVRVPLVAGRAMTAMSVAMADGPRHWTADEVALVEAVATQTQTALEAVRVQRREHAIAQQLQDALQPALPERILGLTVGKFTKPALDEAQIGGDFFDIFPLDKELFAVVIGDVSGKGLAAAQQLALIRNSLRTTLYLYRSPALAASALNSIVTAHDLLVGFVTTWVGVYDALTGKIAYCSCGHEPALIRRTDGLVEELTTTGPPLGVAEGAEYVESVVSLSSGDRLLLYTDGLSESGPNRRELLGTDGLMRLFGAVSADATVQSQVEALIGEVSAYADGIFRDDIAVLLARRE